MTDEEKAKIIAEDVRTLHRLGYAQELWRGVSAFSNFALSMSIICILMGIITFHVGFCSVGGAAIGLGWPLASLYALAVAVVMGHLASAFPTAGGLYHWAAILGGPGWGWVTAWFNLLGLVAVAAAVNVGVFEFALHSYESLGQWKPAPMEKWLVVFAITASQAFINQSSVRITVWLTNLSGWIIMVFAVTMTVLMLSHAWSNGLDASRLIAFTNYSGFGPPGEPVWLPTESMLWLFALGLLLPMFVLTGYDASAHVAEETIGAAVHVPRALVRSVWVSGLFGWVMLSSIMLAIPDMDAAARAGDGAYYQVMDVLLGHGPVRLLLDAGILTAGYLCGLATITSASRMLFAFARDDGTLFAEKVRFVHPRQRTPVIAIWITAALAVLLTAYTPVYKTLTAASVGLLYTSYIVPIVLGLISYRRGWKTMGPWSLGRWFRPLAIVSILGWGVLMVVCVWPPNEMGGYFIAGTVLFLTVFWFAWERRRFLGPPHGVMIKLRQAEIEATEKAIELEGLADFAEQVS